MLAAGVQSKQKLLLSSLSSGVANKIKNAAWEIVTSAVNSVGTEERSLSEIKRFDIKLCAIKTCHCT